MMGDQLKFGKHSIWRETGFVVRQESERESDDQSKVSDLFTFGALNPQVEFSTRLTRKDRLKLAWFFFKAAARQKDSPND